MDKPTPFNLPHTSVWPKFPSVKKYLKSYDHGHPIEEAVANLQRYGRDGNFTLDSSAEDGNYRPKFTHVSACSDLAYLSLRYRWNAVQAALSGSPQDSDADSWQLDWQRAAAYAHWSMRIEFAMQKRIFDDYSAGIRAQYHRVMSLRDTGACIGDLLTLGWFDWAAEGARNAYYWLSRDGFIGAAEDHRSYQAQRFVLQLLGRWQGWTESIPTNDTHVEPLFGFLLDSWDTSDVEALTSLLLAVCDRHTHHARESSRSSAHTFDFGSTTWAYYPFEVLALMRLRALAGLANPRLEHPLMATPLAELPAPSAPYDDALLASVVARLRADLPYPL